MEGMKERERILNGNIDEDEDLDDELANQLIGIMLYLNAEEKSKGLYIYINSPGGSVTAGLAILDTMNFIKPDVSTICIGTAASMGSHLLAAGAKGKRFVLPNSEIMIHQPMRFRQRTLIFNSFLKNKIFQI